MYSSDFFITKETTNASIKDKISVKETAETPFSSWASVSVGMIMFFILILTDLEVKGNFQTSLMVLF